MSVWTIRFFFSGYVDSDELDTRGEQAGSSLASPSYVNLKITGIGFNLK